MRVCFHLFMCLCIYLFIYSYTNIYIYASGYPGVMYRVKDIRFRVRLNRRNDSELKPSGLTRFRLLARPIAFICSVVLVCLRLRSRCPESKTRRVRYDRYANIDILYVSTHTYIFIYIYMFHPNHCCCVSLFCVRGQRERRARGAVLRPLRRFRRTLSQHGRHCAKHRWVS